MMDVMLLSMYFHYYNAYEEYYNYAYGSDNTKYVFPSL